MEADITKELLFPVPIYRKVLPKFLERQDNTIAAIQALRKETEGIERSNSGGWHSHDQLHQSKDPDIAWIMQRALQITQGCILDYAGEEKKGQLHMLSAWANINGKGDWNMPHNHLPCQWSGCFYVRVKDDPKIRNDGNIVFIDPSPFGPHFRQNTNATVQPKTGMMLIFPSYLMHMVEPHHEEEDRISIAFNMQWVDATQENA